MKQVEPWQRSSGSESTTRKPQSVMLSFLGIYLHGQSSAIYSGSIIDVFARLGISVDAVRSTLTRMVSRGLLERHRRGRKMYFSVSDRGEKILTDGYRRIWESGAVVRNWNGKWTMVAFSLPNEGSQERHALRSRLIWAGFGLLQPGLWVAPDELDVTGIVEETGLAEFMTVMTGQPSAPTKPSEVIERAFDLSAIANNYYEFLKEWDSLNPWSIWPDDLARQVVLHVDWLQLVRQNPRLPADYLPKDWPIFRAEHVFQHLAQTLEPGSKAIADATFDMIPLSQRSHD